MFCANCGHEVGDLAVVCTNCGCLIDSNQIYQLRKAAAERAEQERQRIEREREGKNTIDLLQRILLMVGVGVLCIAFMFLMGSFVYMSVSSEVVSGIIIGWAYIDYTFTLISLIFSIGAVSVNSVAFALALIRKDKQWILYSTYLIMSIGLFVTNIFVYVL